MGKAKDNKSSRVTTACNACRSRKQKCSGKKPVCQQCYDYNRPCDWPEQLRRGPARGYVESLEHRLQVTEGVLLRLLSRVSDPELSHIFPEDSLLSDTETGYAPLARLGKKGVEEWSQFPLDSAQNIRNWQRVCTGQESNGSGSPAVGSENSSTVHGGVKWNRLESHEQEHPSSPISFRQPPRQLLSGPGHRSTSEAIGSEAQGHFDHGVSGSSDQDVNAMQTRSSWDGAPSISFQQQFLW